MRTPSARRASPLLIVLETAEPNQTLDVTIELTEQESMAIVTAIRPIFTRVAEQYDTSKYWPQVYDRVRSAFLAPTEVSRETLQDALLWKYGHLGKSRIPGAHRRLISQLQDAWPRVAPKLPRVPEAAFALIESRLGRKTRFITVAFLVHLLFPDQTPILDQHNFRAVNALCTAIRPKWESKQRPSRYADILLVASFMESIIAAWHAQDPGSAPSPRDLDKFLMMHGKSLKGAV